MAKQMTTHHMTGAELQTLREACNLGRDEFAELVGVEARTVKHWENGRAGVPADVASVAQNLEQAIQQGTDAELQRLRPIWRELAPPAPAVLVRFKTPADMEQAREDHRKSRQTIEHALTLGNMPPGVHGAIVARVMRALQAQGQPVRVVWFDPKQFTEWRAASPFGKAWTWARVMLQIQAIPHRGDQPPAA